MIAAVAIECGPQYSPCGSRCGLVFWNYETLRTSLVEPDRSALPEARATRLLEQLIDLVLGDAATPPVRQATLGGCGDGFVASGEVCDDGGESLDCDADCTLAFCGDGTINNGATEQCDDGNTVAGDGCDSTCLSESCGDGIVNNAGTEACDDGNDIDNDGCSTSCEITVACPCIELWGGG